MANTLADQLQAALKRAQEKTGEKTPENAALGVLRSELADLFGQSAPAPDKQLANLYLGRRKTTARLWMEQAKLGESFYDVPGRPSGGYFGMAKDNNVKISTEQCVMVLGPMSSPTSIAGTKLTVVEKDGKTLPDTGAAAKRDKTGSDGGVEAQSAGHSPRSPRR